MTELTEHRLLHVVIPAGLLERTYAAAQAEGVTMAAYVASRLEDGLRSRKPRKAATRPAAKKRVPADK